MDKLLIKNKVYILATIGMLIIIGLVWFLLIPRYNKFQISKSVNDQKISELNDLNKKQAALASKSVEIKKLSDQIEKFNNLIPSGINEADLIVELTSLAEQTGVTVNSYSFIIDKKIKTNQAKPVAISQPSTSNVNKPVPEVAATVQTTNLTKIPIPLQIAGTYSAIENYISRLLNLERIFSIESISLLAGEGGQGSATIQATTYSL